MKQIFNPNQPLTQNPNKTPEESNDSTNSKRSTPSSESYSFSKSIAHTQSRSREREGVIEKRGLEMAVWTPGQVKANLQNRGENWYVLGRLAAASDEGSIDGRTDARSPETDAAEEISESGLFSLLFFELQWIVIKFVDSRIK